MYILNGHLVLFHCYYICLILLIWTCLLFQKNVATHVFTHYTLKTVNGDTHTHTHQTESLNGNNHSGMKLQYSVSVPYSTVCSGHHSPLLLHNHSKHLEEKNNLKMGTENVNAT